jgi:hypothetical protein
VRNNGPCIRVDGDRLKIPLDGRIHRIWSGLARKAELQDALRNDSVFSVSSFDYSILCFIVDCFLWFVAIQFSLFMLLLHLNNP